MERNNKRYYEDWKTYQANMKMKSLYEKIKPMYDYKANKLKMPFYKYILFRMEIIKISIQLFFIDTLIVETLGWRLHHIGIDRKKYSLDKTVDRSILSPIYFGLGEYVGELSGRDIEIKAILGVKL